MRQIVHLDENVAKSRPRQNTVYIKIDFKLKYLNIHVISCNDSGPIIHDT